MMVGQRACFQGIAGLVASFLLWPIFATAQQTALPPGLIEQLNRTQPTTPLDPAQPLPSPLDQIRAQQQSNQPPSALPAAPRPPARVPRTPIELDYSRRAGMPLLQYGYDAFRSFVPSPGTLQTGAVADNYRLSIGDELVITLQGQVARSLRTRIDSEGRIVIPDVPPVAAAGQTFGDVRRELEREVATRFLNTTVFVSVATVRQIAVSVLGEANAPGIYRMGGFATALDALAMAGGVKTTGSLRHIMLERGTARSAIDLYGVLAGVGAAPDLGLADGDRLIIPPIGPTVAVASEVVRPGIYELAGGEALGAQTLLALAGGPLRPSGNRFLKLSLDARGQDLSSELAALAPQSLRAGDILMVLRRDDATVGLVKLDGDVRVPGPRALGGAPDLRRLIGSDDAFLPDPYLLFGAVETTDPQTLARRLVPVDFASVMSGRTDLALKDGDTVIVLSLGDVNYLASADVQAVLAGQPPPLLRERIVTKNPRAVPRGPFAAQETAPPAGEAASSLLPQEQNAQAALAAQGAGAAQSQPAPAAPPQGNAAAAPQGFAANVAARDFLAQQSEQICRGLQELAAIAASARPGRFANAIYAASAGKPAAGAAAGAATAAATGAATATDVSQIANVFPCPPIFDKYPDLLPLVVEYATTVEGAVRIPGPYPILPGTPISAVISEAGGLALDVDLKRVEVTHYATDSAAGTAQANRELVQMTPPQLASLAVSPGDVVHFNPLFTARGTGVVALTGEFRRPATYDILRGEHLSQLIERAGGLTEQAYPYGAVFTRESVREEERQDFIRAAQQLQAGLTAAVPRSQNADQSQALVLATQQLVAQLRNTEPLGRVVVEADPTVLQVKPQLDPLMESGDTVFIPKRPFYVAVAGEVLNPTSLQFRPGATPKDYIEEAGGFSQTAEDDRVFVVLPNGEAEPVKISFWNFTPVEVPPGSTIVVPKDLTPFDLTSFLRDSTQILSQLAISAASLAIIQGGSTR